MSNSKFSILNSKLLLFSFSFLLFPILSFAGSLVLPSMPSAPSFPAGEEQGVGGIASPVDAGGEASTAGIVADVKSTTDGIEDPNAPKPKSDDRKIKHGKMDGKYESKKDLKINYGTGLKGPINYGEKHKEDIIKERE